MNDRTCIVTREAREADDLIRFVAGPDGSVVPDLKRTLPGRGCWVTATRVAVDKAVKRKLFARALKAEVTAPDDLGAQVDMLLARSALGSLGLARKAGQVVMGAAQVESAVRSGKAHLVLHAREASPDGVRKIGNARRAVFYEDGPEIAAFKLFGEAELGLALGGTNVIHAAVLGADAGRAAEKRVLALGRYRGEGPESPAAKESAAKDTE
ncbi:MAG TPA: RNA-binding protein [Mesorhizobium sp.]|jgi:hypothetical protein|nr:RNA-binding protein [Mesorhizobium sp.]